MPCYSPLRGFRSKDTGGIVFKRSNDAGEEMGVPCGQCLGCRLDHSRQWAARIVHEAAKYDDNCFLTLTYDDEHLPYQGQLTKSHYQKFMKRLRKMFEDRRIRYYQCGEYGDQLDRPHYHACLFNLDFPDKQLFKEREGNLLFTSEILQQLWPYGFSTIGELTFESAAYCARYVTKKVTGARSQDHYTRVDINTGEVYELTPEYSTMSRGHRCKECRALGAWRHPAAEDCQCTGGIGRDWYEEYKTDVFPSDECPVPGTGLFKKVPRYYESILEAEDPEQHKAIKKVRRQFRDAHGDEYTSRRLEDKFKVKKAQVSFLKRNVDF